MTQKTVCEPISLEDVYTLYHELNERIFGGNLPCDIRIFWSSRMKVAAGMAERARSTDGACAYRIVLSKHILQHHPDRLEHTLAHEMCHVAEVALEGRTTMGHDEAFEKWRAACLTRGGIHVSVRHTYELERSYVYKCPCGQNSFHRAIKRCRYAGWQCMDCDGRIGLVA